MISKNDILKILFENNIDTINRDTHIKGLSIEFEDDKFIIKKEDKVVYKNKISNYEANYYSQRKFILDVLNSFIVFAIELVDIDSYETRFLEKECIKINNDNSYKLILGNDSTIYTPHDYIKVDIENLVPNLNKGNVRKIYNKFKNTIFEKISKEIEKNVDKNKFSVICYSDEQYNIFLFYVNPITYKNPITIDFIDCVDYYIKLYNSKNIDIDRIRYEIEYYPARLFYSPITNKEFDETLKTVENIVEKYLNSTVKI